MSFPEDRVLVGVMPDPQDLEYARDQHWYRVPVKRMPKGIHAEYVAFYFTSKFGEGLRWTIQFYARRTGHELVRRVDLLPDQADHPRADEQYFKVQLGPLRSKTPPIVSVRWRRITFIQTTWDRFVAAREINDLYTTDNQFVDRIYHALKRQGVQPERSVSIHEQGNEYTIDLLIPCQDGAVMLAALPDRPSKALPLTGDEDQDIDMIHQAMRQRGGPLMVDVPL